MNLKQGSLVLRKWGQGSSKAHTNRVELQLFHFCEVVGDELDTHEPFGFDNFLKFAKFKGG